MQRILYIDTIKGFAILLVVMGHALAWSFPEGLSIRFNPQQPFSVTLGGVIFQLIYSFHMPLFFMVSGYLSGTKESGDIKSCVNEISMKANRLLVPYFATGFLIYLVRGHFGYWFLLALFELYICWSILSYALGKVSESSLAKDVSILLLGFILLKVARVYSIPSFYEVEIGKFVPFYIPFAFGVLMRRRPIIEKVISHPLCYSICLVLFICLFCTRYITEIPIVYQLADRASRIVSLLMCVCVWHIFRTGNLKKVMSLFAYLGKKTMPIYILHILLVIQMSDVGEFIIHTQPVTSFVLQIIYALLASAIAILLSLCTYRIIRYSPYLTRILFGE